MPFKDYRVTSKYGYRIHPITEKEFLSQGIDLVKGHKSDIHAFIGGEVLYAELVVLVLGLAGRQRCSD